ncbi:hypothetical protein RHSIM_Rhsim09G0123800 [Rhododendron simsii]|uniref:Uncharacterized protein n=1 Tax=Rhododendron simsii TaxID=118357 RepID=A0A834L2G4_RHOSS|nr:hypothetical protein RHSIM_RhsimUnG0149500 [Rhododendron simsii]KAF7132965.1 hypothetical protein RHSIM_Rhsim09G0123800 [Rhododendron simsii]
MGSSESNLSNTGSSKTDLAQNRKNGQAVGAAAAPKGTTKLASGSGSQEKMMKAPGREYRMPRKEFETSPAGYFRDLRKK